MEIFLNSTTRRFLVDCCTGNRRLLQNVTELRNHLVLGHLGLRKYSSIKSKEDGSFSKSSEDQEGSTEVSKNNIKETPDKFQLDKFKKQDKLDKLDKLKSEEEESRRRYEKDLPPGEEERHRYWKTRPDRSVNKSLIRTDFFENLEDKNKETFIAVIDVFSQRDVHSRGHVEFIYAALSQMKYFQVHRDLESYKKILDIFPKGRMISANMFQVEFMHYPKQQQCGIDVLEQMEEFGVMPDTEVQQQLTNVFGSQSFPMRKASRMLYWMPKFKNLTPWPLPDPLPDNSLSLAQIAIQRITSVDLSTKVTTYETAELEDCYDDTWIVSGQSEEQQKLIETHPAKQPIYVEGAFRVWIQRNCINYFILRAEPRPRPKSNNPASDPDDVSNLSTIFQESYVENSVTPFPSVHEQDDGVILAVCATGTSSRDSLLSWIRFLEEKNPRLGRDISVIFTLKSPIGPTDDLEILSHDEVKGQQTIDGGSGFSIGSGGNLGPDPRLPNLKQMGIWSESESEFRNWPHDHHREGSRSLKNLEQNKKYLEEDEKQKQKAAADYKTIQPEGQKPQIQ